MSLYLKTIFDCKKNNNVFNRQNDDHYYSNYKYIVDRQNEYFAAKNVPFGN